MMFIQVLGVLCFVALTSAGKYMYRIEVLTGNNFQEQDGKLQVQYGFRKTTSTVTVRPDEGDVVQPNSHLDFYKEEDSSFCFLRSIGIIWNPKDNKTPITINRVVMVPKYVTDIPKRVIQIRSYCTPTKGQKLPPGVLVNLVPCTGYE